VSDTSGDSKDIRHIYLLSGLEISAKSARGLLSRRKACAALFRAGVQPTSRTVRIGLCGAVGGFWLSMAGPAGAVPFALEYEAPAGCPSREAFVEAIRERVPDAHESEKAGRFAFRVTIEPAGDRVRGSLAIGDGTAARQVAQSPCADVANSMVLMIAIALSGERRLNPPGTVGEGGLATEEAAETPPTPPEATAPTSNPAASAGPKTTTAPAEVPRTPERRVPEPRRERESFRAGVWGTAGLSGGVAPFPAIASSGGAELELPWIAAVKPSVRAGVIYASGDTSVDGFGGAEFRLLAFAGRLCPHAFSLSRRWALAACASVELGELTARGVRTPNRRVERMPWFALGLAPRVELALTPVVSLEGELGVRGIVRHDRFVFEPEATEVYDVPRFAPHLSLGASARFP
jgi:hypothetical protein